MLIEIKCIFLLLLMPHELSGSSHKEFSLLWARQKTELLQEKAPISAPSQSPTQCPEPSSLLSDHGKKRNNKKRGV